MSESNHLVIRSPGTFFCEHCGETYAMNVPVPIDVLIGAMESFSRTHKRCKRSARGLACIYCFQFGHDPDKCERLEYGGDWRRWLAGPDTGSSSETLCRALAHGAEVIHQRIDIPRDAADFGKCHRLLKAIPGWRARLGEVRHLKGWSMLVDAWDELERLYEECLSTRDYTSFNKRMHAIEMQREQEERAR